MKTLIRVFVLLLAIFASGQEVLTNDAISKLVQSGISNSLIVNIIQTQPGAYSLTPDDIVKLKQSGVSETILSAMASKTTVPPSNSVKLELKTPVRLSLDETLSSKNAKAGSPLKLFAAEQVSINGHIVIEKGALATGRILSAEKKSFATHNGKLEIAVDSVQALDGHSVPLDGHLEIGGGGVGFGRTGKDAQIEKGQIINAVVAAQTTISLSATSH